MSEEMSIFVIVPKGVVPVEVSGPDHVVVVGVP